MSNGIDTSAIQSVMIGDIWYEVLYNPFELVANKFVEPGDPDPTNTKDAFRFVTQDEDGNQFVLTGPLTAIQAVNTDFTYATTPPFALVEKQKKPKKEKKK